MEKPGLPGSVSSPDLYVANHRAVPDLHADLGANGVSIDAAILPDIHRQPVSKWPGAFGIAATNVPKQTDRSGPVDHDQIQKAVHIQVGKARTATTPIEGETGARADFGEFLIPLAEQKVVRVIGREIGHGFNVALGNEQVPERIVVHILEFRMPARRRA